MVPAQAGQWEWVPLPPNYTDQDVIDRYDGEIHWVFGSPVWTWSGTAAWPSPPIVDEQTSPWVDWMWDTPEYAQGNLIGFGPFADGAWSTGGPSEMSSIGTCRSFLRWKRSHLFNSQGATILDQNGDPLVDPDDDPPDFVYLRLWPSATAQILNTNPFTGQHIQGVGTMEATLTVPPAAESDGQGSGPSSEIVTQTYHDIYGTHKVASVERILKLATNGAEEFWTPNVSYNIEATLPGDRATTSSGNGTSQTKWNEGLAQAFGSYYVELLNTGLSLSTTPQAQAPLEGAGSPGLWPGNLYWDGLTYTSDPNQIDPVTGQPLQVPETRRVAPEEKNHYVVVSATTTYPLGVKVPSSIDVRARRVRYDAAGVPMPTGEGTTLTLSLVTQSQNGSPTPDGAGGMIYTYRTHDLHDDEAVPRRLGGTQDWHINDKMGRWEFRVLKGPSNRLEFKIDKREQVTEYALDWADYYEYRQQHAQSQAELDTWSSTNHPGGLFSHCFSFAGHIYNRYGLNIADNDGTGMFGAASAPDDGPGSLRFFWSDLPNPTGVGDPGHVGVIGPYTYFGYPTRIDNNGKPERTSRTYHLDGSYTDHVFNGPLWRAKDEGVGDTYFGGDHLTLFPKSQTLPGQVNSSISILQELDAE